jgi:hypothetical protein
MPYALCPTKRLSLIWAILLLLGLTISPLVIAQEKPLEFHFERRIELLAQNDRSYEIDLGDVPQNRVLDLRLDLRNESESDRTFDVVASCGCVKLEPSRLAVQRGQSIDLNMVVRTANESALSFGIALVDPANAFSVKLHLKGQVRSELEAIPSILKLRASELGTFSFEVRPRFKELGISKLSCLSDRFGAAKFERQATGAWQVIFDATNKTPPQGVVEDSLLLSCLHSDGSPCEVRVPITYIDRSKVFPNPLVFRDIRSSPALVLIVSGSLVQKPGIQFKIRKPGSTGEPIVPNSIRRRGEHSAVVELLVSRELYEQIEKSKENWFVEVSDSDTRDLEITVPIRGPLN